MTTTPTTGAAPFSALHGAIDVLPLVSGSYPVTAELLSDSVDCYAGTPLIPMHGQASGSSLQLVSFSVSGQYVALQLTPDSTYEHLQGTYRVNGGCADGQAGTLEGTKVPPLTGAFSGSLASSTEELALSLEQNVADAGNGFFGVHGTATFTGVPCFTTADVLPSSTITGDTVALALKATSGDGSVMSLQGHFDPSNHLIQVTSLLVQGTTCAGELGPASLRATD